MEAPRGCVPCNPFARVMQQWLAVQEEEQEKSGVPALVSPMRRLANLMGMDYSNACKLMNGKRQWIGFDTADRIVIVCTDGLGWIYNDELRTIYQGFDFSWLDRKRPCVEAA